MVKKINKISIIFFSLLLIAGTSLGFSIDMNLYKKTNIKANAKKYQEQALN